MTYRHYLDIVRYKSFLDLKSENSQSYLGMLWWILEPLLYLVAFYVIFDLIMHRGGEGFVVFLLCGLVFWRWFDTCIKKSASAVQSNIGIINQVYLPKIIFPVTEILVSTYRFLFILIIFLVFVAIYKGGISLSWLALPAVLATQAALTLGVGICLSTLIPFLPDLRKILDNIMMFFFWMSGVFFDIGELSEENQAWLSLNPMAVLLQQYRAVLLNNTWPDWSSLFLILMVAAGAIASGVFLVRRWDMSFARIVR